MDNKFKCTDDVSMQGSVYYLPCYNTKIRKGMNPIGTNGATNTYFPDPQNLGTTFVNGHANIRGRLLQ